MKWLTSILAAFLVSAATAADAGRMTRVDFASDPEGATVFVDGASRGVTPLVLTDLAPGAHRVRFEKRCYEPEDDFFTVAAGGRLTRHAELAPVKGLLLVTTEPSGCDVSLDGLSFGETPRLITVLDAKDTHRLLLQKAGYQPRTMEVKFSGRTPLVRHEKMILDSGVLSITSEPEGAVVTVNGIARGQTPVKVSDIPKGRATVTFVKNGYAELSREVTLNAGDEQTLYVKLEGLPGSMKLTSVPEGARFYVNDLPEGKGPVVKNALKPGVYTVRVELDGFDTVERKIEVGCGAVVNEEFRLENILGRLEIKTNPVGVQVSVDGHVAGTTKSADPRAEVSDVLVVSGLKAGEHTVIFRRDGYAEAVRRQTVENKKASQLNVRLSRIFKPDIEIETETGTYKGVLIENSPESVVIEIKPGSLRPFPRSSVRRFTPLN